MTRSAELRLWQSRERFERRPTLEQWLKSCWPPAHPPDRRRHPAAFAADRRRGRGRRDARGLLDRWPAHGQDGADPEGPTLGSVFAISGVSGGSIGAAVAVALLSERARQVTGRTVST